MQMLESDWLSYQTPSAISGICGSILADPLWYFSKKVWPPFSSTLVPAVEGRAKRNNHICKD